VSKNFSVLQNKEYPGRVIIVGKDLSDKYFVIVYAITGRSPSSQARKIDVTSDGAWVTPTDEKILEEGNKELLIYPAILYGHGVAVSNGRQTSDIKNALTPELDAVNILSSALIDWEYEPDAPTFTPRISGCVLPDGQAALSIIKKNAAGLSLREYFKIPLLAGKGKMISTYSGPNRDPLPSFEGEPEDVLLGYRTARETADAVDFALKAQRPEQDFRVSVVCVFLREQTTADFTISVINRSERKKHE
jgi:IMP cyclohydrolase